MKSNPDARIASLDRHRRKALAELLNRERNTKKVLDQYSPESELDLFQGTTLSSLFLNAARQLSRHIAVESGQKKLTFRDLEEQSQALAHCLLENGLISGDRVGIYLSRSENIAVAIWGIIRAGGAFVALDPSYPDRRLSSMAETADLKFVIGDGSPLPQSISKIESFTLPLKNSPRTSSLLPDLHESSVVMIAFTSGSSGVPKAIPIEDKGLVNLVREFQRLKLLTRKDRVLAIATISFDVGIRDIIFPSTVGATSIIATDRQCSDLLHIANRIGSEKITYLNLTPSLWNLVARHLTRRHEALKIITSGESLKQPVAEVLLKKGSQLWNLYGPAEASMLATAKQITPGETVTIGRSMGGIECQVCDSNLSQVPVGEFGELLISGVGVNRKYLNQDSAKKDPFVIVHSPHTNQETLFYRTGDKARLLQNGEFEMVGRIDDQQSLNGIRFEPGEIETFLLELPDVEQAAVKVWESDSSEILAAYLSASSDAISKEALVAHLRKSLPERLIPSRWIFLERLPFTKSGKVDRLALPKPEASKKRKTKGADLDPITISLYNLWQDLLQVETVCPSDNFFSLGGNSLLAMAMIGQLPETIGRTAPLSSFLRNPTLEALSDSLKDDSSSSEIQQRDSEVDPERATNCSFQQRYFYTLHQVIQNPSALNCRSIILFEGKLDLESFKRAFHAVIEQNEIYRTVYEEVGEHLRAKVIEDPLPEVKLIEKLIPDGSDWDVEDIIDPEILSKPFNLQADYPIRSTIVRSSPERHLVVMNFHHIACDGGGWNLFWRDMISNYDLAVSGAEIPKSKSDLQYSSYAERQNRRSSESSKALVYWLQQLEDLPKFPLSDFDNTARDEKLTAKEYRLSIPATVWDGINEWVKMEGSTIHNYFLTSLALWKHLDLDVDDFTIGTPVNSRAITGDAEIHGCSINVLPIRFRTSEPKTFADLHFEVKESMTRALEHHEFPLIDLLTDLSKTNGRRELLYHSIFQLRNIHDDWRPFDRDGSATMLSARRTNSQLPLSLEVYPPRDGRDAYIAVATDQGLYPEGESERIAKGIVRQLTQTLEFPGIDYGLIRPKIDELQITIPEEWTSHRCDYPGEISVFDRFVDVAQVAPEKTALKSGGESISYRELLARVNAASIRLLNYGIKPGDRIGLVLERSTDLVVSILALLKLGAVYVPIDPDYPAERIKKIRDDASLGMLLASESNSSRLRNNGLKFFTIHGIPDRNASTGFPKVKADDTAYMMYTSGTTGEPKGSLISHRGIVRLVVHTDYANLGSDETYLFLSSPSFDASTFEIFAPLLNGGTLAIMPAQVPTVHEIGEAIATHHVTTLWLTAGLFQLIVDQAPEVLKPLRQLITGGDTLSPRHVRKCLDHYPDTTLINGYGPTENTTFSCCYTIPRDHSEEKPVPIGRPIANSEAYILDSRLRHVRPGAIGELWVGGDGLSSGYWKRDELNQVKFRPHPFSSDPNQRIYQTGDLARFREDGVIEFLGRSDTQVKIRGFRVELGEVDRAIRSCSGVGNAAAILFEGDAEAKSLAAVVVPDSGSSDFDWGKIRRELSSKLPNYLIPTLWSSKNSLPLTVNGKIDKSALAKEFHPDHTRLRKVSKPVNRMERDLLELWCRVFQNDNLGCEDDFFDVGGNSLLAIRLTAEIPKVLGRPTPLGHIFKYPTIRSMAKVLSINSSDQRALVPLRPKGKGSPLFLLHGWGGDVFGFVPFAKEFRGPNPIFGIQALEHSSEADPLSSFEKIAKNYAREICKHQEVGPYFLGGFSLGSFVAFETARQLQKMGKEVGQLFVIDGTTSNLPRSISAKAFWAKAKLRLPVHFDRVRQLEISSVPRYLLGRIRSFGALASRYRLLRKSPDSSRLEAEPIAGSKAQDHYVSLFDRYFPTPSRIPTTLVLSTGNATGELVWSHLIDENLKIFYTDLNHLEIPSSPFLQDVIRERMAEV